MDKQNISTYLKIFQEGTTTEKLKAIREIEKDSSSSQGTVLLIQAFADECWIVRKCAHEVLVGLGEEVVDKLEANFPFENSDLAYWTVKTLEKLGGNNYRQIIKMLDSDNSLTQSACIRALGSFSNDEVVSLLIYYLKDSDWYIRKEAARSLEKMGDFALASLKQAFVDNMNSTESEDVSYWTIRLLARIIGVKAIPSFMNLFKSEKQNIRYYAVTALGEIDDEEATKYLINALEDKSWIIRERAAELLKARGESVISTLKAAFYSKGSDTKFWTIKIISSIMGSGGIEFLAKVAKSEEEEIKYFVINALGENQDEQSIRLLISFFQEKSWILRKRASEILQKIGNRSIDFLIENTKSDNKDESFFSLNTLAYIGGRAHDYLAGLLESGDYKVKQDIINSFEDIPDDIVLNKNLRYAFYNCLSDFEWKIRYSASKLLDQISDRIFSEILELFARKSSDINYWISQIVVKNIDALYQKLEVLLKSKDPELIALSYNIILWTLKECTPEVQIKFLKLARLYYQNRHFPAFFTFIKQLPARYLMFLLDFMTTVIPRANLNSLIKEHLLDDDYFIRSLFMEIAFIIDDSEIIAEIKNTLADPKSPTYEKIFSLFSNANDTLQKYSEFNMILNSIRKAVEKEKNDPLIKLLACENEEEIMDIFNLINIDKFEVREKLGKYFTKTTSSVVCRLMPFYLMRLDNDYKEELLKIIDKSIEPEKILFFLESTIEDVEMFNFYSKTLIPQVLTIDKKVELFEDAIFHENPLFQKYLIMELISITLERIDKFFIKIFSELEDRDVAFKVFNILVLNINHKDYKIRDKVKNLFMEHGINFFDLIVKYRFSGIPPMMEYVMDSLIEEVKGDSVAVLRGYIAGDDKVLKNGAIRLIKDLGLR